jgi:hypothetical protein
MTAWTAATVSGIQQCRHRTPPGPHACSARERCIGWRRAYHILWSECFAGRFERPLLLTGVAAAVARFRFKVGAIPVIGACGLVGLAGTILQQFIR